MTAHTFQNLPPGVCVPWETKEKEAIEAFGAIKGDPGIIQKEWAHLDMFAYIYLWWWVHR